MPELLQYSISLIQLVELVAVIFGFTYVLLAIREHHWCWYAAFLSGALFLGLFWNIELYLMSTLQLYYMGIAIYGLMEWRPSKTGINKPISQLSLKQHLLITNLIIAISVFIGWLLSSFTNDAMPYLDTITTVGSLITTWMVARKILENWLYWIAIDAISIYIYIDRELYLTTLLFLFYLIAAIYGYYQWKLSYHRQ